MRPEFCQGANPQHIPGPQTVFGPSRAQSTFPPGVGDSELSHACGLKVSPVQQSFLYRETRSWSVPNRGKFLLPSVYSLCEKKITTKLLCADIALSFMPEKGHNLEVDR